jgi:hypothetical protein
LLCSVLQALHGLTLFCTRVMTFLDSLQCLVFLPFLLLDDLAQFSSLLLSPSSTSRLYFFRYDLRTETKPFCLFFFLIDTFYAIKEVESGKESMSPFLLLLPADGILCN